MLGLIIGGSGSGKSAIAETLIVSYGASRRYYIATMSASDAESQRRIARHRRMRDGKGFETLECPTDLATAVPDAAGDILLECLSNLVANEMFLAGESRENTICKVMGGIDALCRSNDHVIIVTNNVFEDGISYPRETETYIACLGELNRRLAEAADLVIEAHAGIPTALKGELPSCLQNQAYVKEKNGMILIIGGAYQGKLAWTCRKWALDPDGPEIWNGADGMPSESDWLRIRVVNGLHQIIRGILDDEQAMALLKEKLLNVSAVPGRIVLTDELGCGLVPISTEERKWRENTGRFCEALAKEADEVYRVSCGLAQKLQ